MSYNTGAGAGMFPMQSGSVSGPTSGPAPPQNPQWSGYGQQTPQSGTNFYSQQVPPTAVSGPVSRFDRPVNTSKQALSHMLRMRLPTNQSYMGQTGQQPNMNTNFQSIPRQQFIR